jgi:hypothetical protein
LREAACASRNDGLRRIWLFADNRFVDHDEYTASESVRKPEPARNSEPADNVVETTRRKAHQEMLKSLFGWASSATTCDNSAQKHAHPPIIMAASKSAVNDSRSFLRTRAAT